MAKKKGELSQKQLVFYVLYREQKKDLERYVSAFEFVGEIFVEPVSAWFLMSYKCPTRLTDIFQENPNLLERKLITGKSGAQYFCYRFKGNLLVDNICDDTLRSFYYLIKEYEKAS